MRRLKGDTATSRAVKKDQTGVRTASRAHRRALGAVGVVGAAAMLLAACGSSSSSKGSTATTTPTPTTAKAPPQPTGTKQAGGTVMWAEAPAATPNYIFPMAPFADFSVANLSQFQQLMYRPLYWFGTNGSPTVDFAKSVGKAPVWTNGDKTVTVSLNHYTWSDGEVVSARDVVFWMNLLKAEKKNWAAYVPTYFPDNVTSITMPGGPTGTSVTFNLNKSYNPTWFLYNELSQITPMPLAWDKTSASAATPTATSTLPDATATGAAAVYTFLTTAAKSLTTYASSPIWTVVDGPWKLSDFTTGGGATFVPNGTYTGTDKPVLSKFIEVPYTTDVAEFNTIRSGTSALQVGYLPAQDVPKLQAAESEGYSGITFYPYAFNYMAINFTSTSSGALFKQLYIRQALQELIDQSGWITAYFNKLAGPSYGPVPVLPANPFSDTFEKANPYPFSTTTAAALLTSHGWTVKKGGTTTCAVPAKCGAGITAGQALSFNLDFASGSAPLTSSLADYKSVAAQVGVQLNTTQKAFDDVIGEAIPTSKTWEIANWGGGWVYAPDYYASGEELYATGAGSNSGAYSDPTADKLIQATTTVGVGGSQSALDAYQDYIAKQLPVLFQPAPATEDLVSTKLGGTVLKPNAFENLDPESWYYVSK